MTDALETFITSTLSPTRSRRDLPPLKGQPVSHRPRPPRTPAALAITAALTLAACGSAAQAAPGRAPRRRAAPPRLGSSSPRPSAARRRTRRGRRSRRGCCSGGARRRSCSSARCTPASSVPAVATYMPSEVGTQVPRSLCAGDAFNEQIHALARAPARPPPRPAAPPHAARPLPPPLEPQIRPPPPGGPWRLLEAPGAPRRPRKAPGRAPGSPGPQEGSILFPSLWKGPRKTRGPSTAKIMDF